LPIKSLDLGCNTSTGDTYVTISSCVTMCISNLIAYILQISWSNVLNRTYSGTKLLNSYPPFKEPPHGKLCLQVTM